MQALILDAEAKTAKLKLIPIPTPNSNEVLIKIHSISLNPVDPLYVAHPLASTGRTIGSDFSGTVIALGSSVPTNAPVKPGIRVAGFLQGVCSVNDRPGAFAEYVVADWDLIWKVPDSVSFEQAAGVSLVALTAAQGLWYRLGLSAPFQWDESSVEAEHPEWKRFNREREELPEEKVLNFFVYGASTAVGLYVAQMARISAQKSGRKLRLYGAASQKKWEMLTSKPYRYDGVVDYHEADWPDQVKGLVGEGAVHFAYDAISEDNSVAHVSSLLAKGGRMAIVRSKPAGAWNVENVIGEPIYGAVWEGLGAEIQYSGFVVPRSEAARKFAVDFYSWLSNAAGKVLEPVRVRIMPGGLEKVVEDGFVLLGSGKVSERAKSNRDEEWMKPVQGEKLVYNI